jgi:transcriptional regulator with XRE-family HTH domain
MARPRVVDSPVRSNLPSFLKTYRSANNLTQKDLADKIGIKLGSYKQYENGKQTPGGDNFDRLRKFFGTAFPSFPPTSEHAAEVAQVPLPFEGEIRIESLDCIVSATLERKPPRGFEITLHIRQVESA